MKRFGNFYDKICTLENLLLADKKASKGKSNQFGVKKHKENRFINILNLQMQLLSRNYKTSEYSIFTINETKERIIHRLPYIDRVLHHAVLNIIGPVLISTLTYDTYSCIPKRGVHLASYKLRKAVSQGGGVYCLKLDIKKFYENVDHVILKTLLREKFKDTNLLWLLEEVIDSVSNGLPLGNYFSQVFANFYLNNFDHWIKEIKGVKNYFRYMDDMVIISHDKEYLRTVFIDIEKYLLTNLKLVIKSNYQIFPIHSRGIDFVGYKHYSTHTLLRKRIKKNFIKMLRNNPNYSSTMSYNGWIKHCNSLNLWKNVTNNKYTNTRVTCNTKLFTSL